MKKSISFLIAAACCVGVADASAQSANAAAEVVYACTRRANGGVTQTYIARLKNGVPVCNNRKHVGPFPLLDLSQINVQGQVGPQGATGPAGANGKDGVNGKDGATGPAGAPGPDGAKVTGTLRACTLSNDYDEGPQERSQSWSEEKFRAAHCVLEGTSFTYRHLFSNGQLTMQPSIAPSDSESPISNDDQNFTMFHVPDGNYVLSCDIEKGGRKYSQGKYLRVNKEVSVVDGADVSVGLVDLCDADCDGFTAADGDCDDTNSNVYPGAYEQCDGVDNDCNPETEEAICG